MFELAAAVLGGACFVAATLLAVLSLRANAPRGERTALALMGVGAAALLAVLIGRSLRSDAVPVFSLFDALACYALTLTAVYLLMMVIHPARGMNTLVLPYVLIVLACGFPGLSAPAGPPVPLQGVWLVLHMLTGFAAYAVFSLTSLLAIAYLVQDYNLKHKRLGAVWERLPSLETLDHLMSRLVGVAFLLFTVAIILGFILVRRSGGGDEWVTDPKVGATLATWILFGVIVHMRASADRHGRGVALVTVAGLACMLFAFIGVHVMAQSVHDFLRLRAGGG